MKKHVIREHITLNFKNIVKRYQIVFEMHLNSNH